MKFTEKDNQLIQAECTKLEIIKEETLLSEWVCRMPVMKDFDGKTGVPYYKLLPGYQVEPPSRVQIDKSDLFAYLTYEHYSLLSENTPSWKNINYVNFDSDIVGAVEYKILSMNNIDILTASDDELKGRFSTVFEYGFCSADYWNKLHLVGITGHSGWYKSYVRQSDPSFGLFYEEEYYLAGDKFVLRGHLERLEQIQEFTNYFITENY